MENWVVTAKRADFRAIGETFGIDPVVARVIVNRGLTEEDEIRRYLFGGIAELEDPLSLADMDRARALVQDAIRGGKKIRIMGDYDIDGVMASYILKRGITELGGDADVRIPDRMRDGYGMNTAMVEEAKEDGVDLIITCDNGISAGEAVRLAKSLGMTVIVTDHHEVSEMPEADAVVDPKREDDHSMSPHLCGASVAWKLILAMGGDPEYRMLQFAAFATVGDIVELTGENRIIVKEGLKQLRETDNAGLRALAEVTGAPLASLNAYHIGFILGPCINAGGRLGTADRALDLLEAPGETAALRFAEELKELNESRKAMTESGVREAEEVIAENGLSRDRVLVVFLPDIHESIAGIIAGRLRESHTRPVFVLTRSAEGVRGSGRSIEAYSMFEELQKVRDILVKFGGHPMAAGLSLAEEMLPELRRRLNENCALTEADLVPKVRIDVPMPVSYVSHELIRQLELLEPFGKGNEKPLFAQKHVFFDHPRIFGARHNLLRARVRSMTAPGDSEPDRIGFQPAVEGSELDAICFRDVDRLRKRIEESPDIAIVYEPEINDYMGQSRIQIVIHHFQ